MWLGNTYFSHINSVKFRVISFWTLAFNQLTIELTNKSHMTPVRELIPGSGATAARISTSERQLSSDAIPHANPSGGGGRCVLWEIWGLSCITSHLAALFLSACACLSPCHPVSVSWMLSCAILKKALAWWSRVPFWVLFRDLIENQALSC